MDTAQWPQGIGVVVETRPNHHHQGEKKPRPEKEKALNCPRCNSTNTKFCYYNNYSLSQPRYFCKTCRRYWTEGGSLRNVPVGGGSRKNRRSLSSSSSSSLSSAQKKLPEHSAPFPPQNPSTEVGHDLNLLLYPPPPGVGNFAVSGSSGILHLNPFHIPMSTVSDLQQQQQTNLFHLHDVKPGLSGNFTSGEGYFGNNNNNDNENSEVVEESGARLFFPNLEDLKSSSGFVEQYRDQQEANGFWNIGSHGGGGGDW